MKRKILDLIIITIIFVILTIAMLIEYEERKLLNNKQAYIIKNLSSIYVPEKEVEKQNTVIEKEEIIKEYKGYNVSAKLEIPKIDLETYVLKNFSKSALSTSVVKFWGVEPNQIGNFCVAGHNFINKNMFHNLKKLSIGDRLFLSDNEVGKIEYEVYEFSRVPPEDVSCLSEETNGRRIVTLITCTSDSKNRIIVKAKEV